MTTPKMMTQIALAPVNVLAALAVIGLCSLGISETAAQQPGWSPVIIATGQYRQQIKSTPIEQRPNRPFHFYGNRVRRSYYRGATNPVAPMAQRPYTAPYQPYSGSRPPTNYVAPNNVAPQFPVNNRTSPPAMGW